MHRSGGVRVIHVCLSVVALASAHETANWRHAWASAVTTELAGDAVRAAGAATTADLARRWEGSWVVREADYPGSLEAWTVRGGRVRIYDALRGELRDEEFVVLSPCRIQRVLVLDAARGDTRVTIDTFAFAPEGLLVAPRTEGGGVRRGAIVTACIGDDVFTYESPSGVCRRWTAAMEDELTGNAECQLTIESAGSTFVVRPLGGGEAVDLAVVGDALVSSRLLRAEPQVSEEAARRRADEVARRERASR